MRKRNEPKPIQGWGWLGDAAEEAAVRAMAPARRVKNARDTMAVMKAKNTAAARAGVSPRPGNDTQLSDDEYRQLAKQPRVPAPFAPPPPSNYRSAVKIG